MRKKKKEEEESEDKDQNSGQKSGRLILSRKQPARHDNRGRQEVEGGVSDSKIRFLTQNGERN